MINVMTYDLYGSWTNKIGHHSALFHRHEEKSIERELNTVCSNQNKYYFRIE
jgi:GH18 family chitinase